MESYKIIISGRVQGVFYRRFAKINADRFGIKGYVKNLHDGSVEVICEGDKKRMGLFLSELKKGPPHSDVEKLDIKEIKEKTYFESFEVRY
ncbi:MAG: acylphosphatase [Nanoarchaeota archaeon]|nr:acylphosphatase [Nanoarchaeota archaeon]